MQAGIRTVSPKSRATHLLTEAARYDPPAYVWAITIAGPTAIAATTCAVLYGHPPARLYAGRRPGQRKGNAMNTRSPYPDAEVPEISQPRFVLDRSDERGAAVPLMGPADHGSASPLMGPAAAGTGTPLMGPAAPAAVTPLLGPADRGTMVSLMGPADPGTATPLMLPSR